MTNPSAIHLGMAKKYFNFSREPETKNSGTNTDNPLFLKDLRTQTLQVAGTLGAALWDISFNLDKQPSAGSHGNNDPFLLLHMKQNTWHFACQLSKHVWLKNILNELGLKHIPSALSCDNNGANDLAHNP